MRRRNGVERLKRVSVRLRKLSLTLSDKVGGCKIENWKMQIEKVKLLDIGSYSPIETYKSWVV